jgi:hypothetical protein
VIKESSSNIKIFVGCHFFSVIEFESEGVNGLLINISASLMVMDKSNSSSKSNLSSILHSCELSKSFSSITFLEDTEGLPENEDWVLSFSEFIVTELSNRAPVLFSDEVVDGH